MNKATENALHELKGTIGWDECIRMANSGADFARDHIKAELFAQLDEDVCLDSTFAQGISDGLYTLRDVDLEHLTDIIEAEAKKNPQEVF
jgi:hypothetical protein